MRAGVLLAGVLVSARLLSAALLDPTFDIGTGADGLVEQALQLPGGKVLVCGNFTSFNGESRAYIARLNNDGSVDPSFEARPGYWVRHMALQPDGKIVIGGYFTTVAGAPRNLIARLNPDGSLDTSFNPGKGADIIIAGGIDGNMTPFVFWQEVQPDGKIVITGNFRTFDGVSSTGIARLNADGSRDASFQLGPGFDSWGRTIQLLPNGQILVGGWFTSYNNRNANRLVRINPDGSPDDTFNPFYGDKTAVYAIAVAPDGKYITSGDSINPEGLFRRNIVKLNTDGSVDSSWVGESSDKTESLWMQPNGSVVAAGYFTQLNGVSRQSLGRFYANGTLDESVNLTIDNFIWTVAPAGEGKVLIAGGFTTVDGASRRGVARLSLPNSAEPPQPDLPPAPVISGIALNNGKVEFAFAAELNHTYIIQARTPADRFWSTVTSQTASRPFIRFSAPAPGRPTLYRIQAQ